MTVTGRSTRTDTMPFRMCAGGRLSVAIFAKLLGLLDDEVSEGGPHAHVRGVTFIENHFEVVLEVDGAQLTLIIEKHRGRQEQRPFIKTSELALWYRGQGLSETLESVLRGGVSRWSGLTVERLARAMARDPELTAAPDPKTTAETGRQNEASLPEPVIAADRASRSKKLVGVWDRETTFADFLAIDVFDLLPYESIEASNPFLRISHSDLECHRFMPREKASNVNVVDFPWIPTSSGGTVKALEKTLSTDLVEDDVIMGCNPRVCELLDHVLDDGVECPIIFANTCLPATTAEDVISVLQRYREAFPVPILIDDRATSDFEQEMFADLFVLPAIDSEHDQTQAVGRDPRAINVVGFTRDESFEELSGFLSDLDIHVNAAVLPSLTSPELERFPRGSLNVLLRRTGRWDGFFDVLCSDETVPSISPHGPYGIKGTRRWLEAIVEALGQTSAFEDFWESHLSGIEESWDELRARARGHRIIVAGRGLDIERLADPANTNGVPLVPVLEEMGFELDVLIHEDGIQGLDQVVLGLLEKPEPHGIRAFRDQQELEQMLMESDADAVVSNYAFDWRLTQAGKGRVSLRHFEMGVTGALNTLRRILRVCATPFFKKYQPFLERDEAGFFLEADR